MGVNLLLFVKQLSILSGVLFVFYALIAFLLPEKYTSKAFWGFVPFFYTVVLASKAILNKLAKDDKKKFSLVFMRINASRFVLYLGVLLAWSFINREDAVPFIITFFVFYFAYTIFEVSFLHREIKS